MSQDPYLWLEEIHGEKATQWVNQQNKIAKAKLKDWPLFEETQNALHEMYTSDKDLPYAKLHNGYFYNMWRDKKNVRGLWRRIPEEKYGHDNEAWETLFDLDELAEEHGESYVWRGALYSYDIPDRCLINLSDSGKDAVKVLEFDLEKKEIIEDGFYLPFSKSSVQWKDRDTLYFSPAFEGYPMTSSHYPCSVREWKRGERYEESVEIYCGPVDGVRSSIMILRWEEDILELFYDFENWNSISLHYRNPDGSLHTLPLPKNSRILNRVREDIVIETKEDFGCIGAGAVFSVPAAVVRDGIENLSEVAEVVFVPGEGEALESSWRTADGLYLNIIKNVTAAIKFARKDKTWSLSEANAPREGAVFFMASDGFKSSHYYLMHEDFTQPRAIFYCDQKSHQKLFSLPEFFKSEGLKVEQLWATSQDGTKVPYFVIAKESTQLNGNNKALLTGYGGFDVSLTPSYLASAGVAWLEEGGVFVQANLRGGGEFGPTWRLSAIKEGKQKTFDDFYAVAEDLISRGITLPRKLGISGGSNGGLLVGAALTQRPELFGAVRCNVPLLDMLRYTKLPPGISWMSEYGNPDVPEEADYIRKYSPYQNLSKEKNYPPIYFFTSTADDRVHPGHARKMAALMLEQGHDVLFYENQEGGHGGSANQIQRAENDTLGWAFLHKTLGD